MVKFLEFSTNKQTLWSIGMLYTGLICLDSQDLSAEINTSYQLLVG